MLMEHSGSYNYYNYNWSLHLGGSQLGPCWGFLVASKNPGGKFPMLTLEFSVPDLITKGMMDDGCVGLISL